MDDSARDLHPSRCTSCATRMAHDQRYCVACGARRGPLPARVEVHLAEMAGAGAAAIPSASADVADEALAVDADGAPDAGDSAREGEAEAGGAAGGLFDGLIAGRWLLTPRIASLAVMSVLSFGVIAGSLTTPGGAAGLARTLIVAVSPGPQSAPQSPAGGEAGGGGGGGGGGGAAPTAAAPVTITETVGSPPTPAQPAAAAPTPAMPTGGGSGGSSLNHLPPIKHVWLIMLSDQGYNAAFQTATGHPYLAKTLRAQGELITNYYGVASSSLANAAAVISGQGPTQQTAADCPTYEAITPGTLGPNGQATGDGCIYPALAQTLPDELAQNGQTWRGYIEGVDTGPPAPAGQPATATTCRHPAVGSSDPNHAPSAQDPYVTWHNPFVYFQSLLNSGCDKQDVGLSHLATDLKKVSTTPNFSYIAPDPCHDGSDTPCHPGAPAGLSAADAFLKSVVPEIKASPAYKQDGLIVVTFDQAPQSGPTADSSSCCAQPTFPNLTGSGAGSPSSTSSSSSTTTDAGTTTTSTTTQTGSVTASVPTPLTSTTLTAPVTTTSTETTTGTTGAPGSSTTGTSTTTGTQAAPAGCSTTTTSDTPSSTSSSESQTQTSGSSTTGPASSTTTSSSSTAACSGTGTPPGGGQVGALLLSRYVGAGSVDAVSDLNHFSLLKTLEDLFGVAHLGYTQDPSLPEFDSAVFNAG